jgi:hypothetical protein
LRGIVDNRHVGAAAAAQIYTIERRATTNREGGENRDKE